MLRLIQTLREAGLTTDEILTQVEERGRKQNEQARQRMRKHRSVTRTCVTEVKSNEINGHVTRTCVTGDSIESFFLSSESPLTPKPRAREAEVQAEFEQEFWPAYPRKVAKPRALKAYTAARLKRGITKETILAGVRVYSAANLELKYTAHPATWLNDDRWGDDAPTNGRRDGVVVDGVYLPGVM
jgi:DNA-binding transcriptional MerR regulator